MSGSPVARATARAVPPWLTRPLVVGLGVTGTAVARSLRERGARVRVVDDHPSDALVRRAESLDVDLVAAPGADGWSDLVADCSVVLPSPGVPDRHPVLAAAATTGVGVASEFDVAGAFDDRPLVAITGTNGKTTVTTLVTAMLRASGRRAVDAGNTEVPLVAAIEDPEVEVFVVEASSFRLGHTRHLAPAVATWLNFAPDHLDVHRSLEAYEQAKARVWRELPPDGVAVANADDPVVAGHVPTDRRVVTYGLGPGASAGWTQRGDRLEDDGGRLVAEVAELWRDLPHDRSNALAAAASAVHAGGSLEGARQALRSFGGLAHRVELVGEVGGVACYDDSKATTPHATLAAVSGFDDVVLIAGGRNKGVDLSVLGVAAPPVRAVVGIGEAGAEVAAAFDGRCPAVTADSMGAAVDLALGLAAPGVAVLLSPGCASFDWYGSYAERGDAFAAEVRDRGVSR
jgi:UDP-N-acetylmuramoylalanine--D-glutamate ligase